MIVAIAALQADDNGIGLGKELLYKISADLQRFKRLRIDNPLIVGRTTLETFYPDDPGKPLPKSPHIVVTRNPGYIPHPGVRVANSLPQAISIAQNLGTTINIVGGGQIYKEAFDLNLLDRLELTLIEGTRKADIFFPTWRDFGKITNEEFHFDAEQNLQYRFVTIDRH